MWRKVLWTFLGLLIVAVLGGGFWFYRGVTSHANVTPYAALHPADALPQSPVRATYLGVSTLLFDDGETQIMTDGFFSRPDPTKLFLSKISPDEAIIAQSLARAGVKNLAALIVCHSHYDHAMDSAVVARKTGALFIGSPSSANIALGGDLPNDRIRTPAFGEPLRFGKFTVKLFPSAHVSNGYPSGQITAPLRPPARANEYLMGEAYVVLIEHEGHALAINASAGFLRGALAGQRVDTVMLGIGGLGKTSPTYRTAYWREIVEATDARHVVAIHWDNFARPLDQPLQPMPNLLDDFETSMAFLHKRGREAHVSIALPQAWRAFDPFEPFSR